MKAYFCLGQPDGWQKCFKPSAPDRGTSRIAHRFSYSFPLPCSVFIPPFPSLILFSNNPSFHLFHSSFSPSAFRHNPSPSPLFYFPFTWSSFRRQRSIRENPIVEGNFKFSFGNSGSRPSLLLYDARKIWKTNYKISCVCTFKVQQSFLPWQKQTTSMPGMLLSTCVAAPQHHSPPSISQLLT